MKNPMVVAIIAVFGLVFSFPPSGLSARDGGFDVTSGLWAKAVLNVPGTPVTLVWQMVGADITPSGDQVISGYFYADPSDFAYGSPYNPELFVKIYIATSGWCNIAFNHVTVDSVTVYSAHNYAGAPNKTGTASLSTRLVEHQYDGAAIGDITSGEEGSTPVSTDAGYKMSSGLWARAVLQPSSGPVTLIWKEVGSDITPSGDKVVSGYFYAASEDFAYGSEFNPELFVKIYIAANGWCNIAFNHVTVDNVSILSAHNYAGSEDQTGVATLSGRLVEDQYDNVSVAALFPGQFLTLTNTSLKAGQQIPVRLKDESGYDVTISAKCVTDGSVRIQVPPYIFNNDVCEGDITVSIAEINVFERLHVNDTIPITYETGERPGDVLRWWLNESVLTNQKVLSSLDTFSSDTGGLTQQLHNEINRLQNAVTEFDTTGTMTLYFNDGSKYSLTESNLRLADEMLFLKAVGLTQAYNRDNTALMRASLDWMDDYIYDPNTPQTQRDILIQLRQFKDETIPNVLNRIKSGSDLFTAFVTSEAGLAALYVGGAVSSGWAVAIGGVVALSYAAVTGSLSEGIEWFQSKLGNAMGDLSASDYEFGEEWLERAIDGVKSFAFNLGSGASQTAGELANNIWNAWSALEAEVNLYCATQESQSALRSLSSVRKIPDVAPELCDSYSETPITKVTVQGQTPLSVDQSGTFTVSVSGGKPAFKFDINWGDDSSSTRYSIESSSGITHEYHSSGIYTVNLTVTDIVGHTAAAKTTVSVSGSPGETTVTFPDMWDFYTVTLTFPDGQANGYTVVTDTDVYNTDELVEIRMPNYPSSSSRWPTATVPVKITVSGNDYDDWLFYRNSSKSDWTRRVLLTSMTTEEQDIGSSYYFIVVYPESGPYRTIAFRLVGTGG